MSARADARSHGAPPSAAVASATRARAWLSAHAHHLRLLRPAAIAWILILAGVGAGVVPTFDEDRVATEAERRALEAMEDVPAFELLSGRYVEIGTVEGFTLSRWGVFAIGVAVWGMITGVGLVRGAEDTGHVEPLRAGLITPRALLVAALAAVVTTHAIFAVAIGLGHTLVGMDGATSWALGVAMGLLATSFALVARWPPRWPPRARGRSRWRPPCSRSRWRCASPRPRAAPPSGSGGQRPSVGSAICTRSTKPVRR